MRIFQIQRITAVLLVVFMALHMIVVHYPPGTIDFSRVLVRLENPVWKAIDIAFLASVLTHAVLGLYAVAIDSQNVARYRRILAVVGIAVTLVAFAYGTWTILSFQMPATAGF